MSIFQNARFYTTVNHMKDLPATRAEVAFVGRSNAGKSSAINTLANRTRLAYVSKTPGRTQHINFFELGDECFLVDLPGYGYAEVPEAVRAHWVELLGRYLQTRQSLIGLLLIMDARHPLKDLDRRMLEFFRVAGRPVHILLSKADKMSRQEQNKVLAEVKRELADYPSVSVQMFSSLKKTGVDEVEQVVKGWFDALPPQDDGMAEL
ncbi:ribosome biogenesis GTP-binding protein YihA/YsxC [Chromobacterium vaccinii]|uniref:Probable GTP-binding protein EngB n=4 Tax=Chromobacteriaceae TaxID=1499392 RepID=A0A1D9LJ74_9NEIS|nr:MULTISPECIES: ribosome biogenesis GTP-binding protein YihA/YsxC [Chromobacteriaceae]AOZ51254.1 YihA family ribosome biogenesis GTP-binding protein [Chromobacterium vaccinii]AVG15522.1 YihA family ribosome biogenesis GTP-binding protein [Chromobacterium vaccinii]ERE18729.1 GTP-binding protein YsxC [Pseudogulbenkiania ferrooxidans EGD-HP2]MBX9297155.1 ribosome biogenesis GTP-binding protein YihA/YsxC [Chromobacterium vaccinii]MBX9349425.1 ribosome biogenesis GTP-binding protein YihA/YsxC [Chr